MPCSVAENLASQFHRGVAHRDRALSDVGFRTHALGDAERPVDHLAQESSHGAVLPGQRVGGFHLSQNLRLAHHHRIQAGRDAEQVANGFRTVEAVEIRSHPGALDMPGIGQKAFDGRFDVGLFVGGHRDLDAIAGGEDHAFQQPRPALEIGKSLRQRLIFKSQAFAHLHGRGAMVQAGEEQFHRNRVALNPACAAQVSAEQPSTASAMTAALRPRQPAEARRIIITSSSAQVTSESWMRASPIQLVAGE